MENQSKIHDLLQSAFDDLSLEDLKRFKDKLSHSAFEGKGSISEGQLETADRIDTKNLLVEFYGGPAAIEVTIKVLTQLNLRDSAAKLSAKRDQALGPQQAPETSAHAYRVKYREHIQNKYSTIKSTSCHLDENVKLKRRYTKLIIVNERHQKIQREELIMASGQRRAEIMSKYINSITIGNLFESDRNGQSPHIVILQGTAGIGKTLTARKIMFDWANGELYQKRFDYVFYINCREIDFGTDQGSVEDLILKNFPDKTAPTKEILKNPEKLLFIIDGFDELRFSFNQPTSILCSETCEKQPMEITLSSLFWKKVLDKSYLLIITRPIALEKLKECWKDECYLEILGFSENEKKEYFDKFFGNKEQAEKAFNFIKYNEMLFTMCFVPSMCLIICTVLKQKLEGGEDLAQTSNTITSVYMHYLFSLLKDHSSNSKQLLQNNLKELCSLAADGICRQKIWFEEEDIKKHGLNKINMAESCFLNENIEHEGVYSFIHLSFQEFFAALFYIFQKEEITEEDAVTFKNVKMLLEKDLKVNGNSLILTVRFMFGLLNDKRKEELEKELSCKISPLIKKKILEWIEEKPISSLFNHALEETTSYLQKFHCLYEIQEKKIVQTAMNRFTKLELINHTFSKMDQIALSFCIKHCCKLQSVRLRLCSFETEEGEEDEDTQGQCKRPRLAQHQHEPHDSTIYLLCQALKDTNSILNKLCLSECFIGDACCRDLASVLSIKQSLRELYVEDYMGDSGVQLLCEGLKHPHCKVQALGLSMCYLTSACCGDLAAVLRNNQNLTWLDLSSNELGYDGMRLLSEGLKHPNCKVQSLCLEGSDIVCDGCEDLAAVLITNQNLTELELGYNNLGDVGVRRLCEGLKNLNCKLQKLKVDKCYFTDACCGDLADALKTNQRLTELDLSINEVGDAGVQLLCEGLKQNCMLQNLDLSCCDLTDTGCEYLTDVLKTSQSLTTLNLSGNDSVGDAGVWMLCEGLKHPNCRLQSLCLYSCALSAACCGALASALITNQSLKDLNLGHNLLEDSGVQLLYYGLKDPNCKLQTLGLQRCGVSPSGCQYLADVLQTSQNMTSLDLSENYFMGDTGVQVICEGLKYPNCKLQSLRLSKCNLSTACCGDLFIVLFMNQTLTTLYLSWKKLEYSGRQLLCHVLKHPNCKLKKLGIGFGYLSPQIEAELDAVKNMKPDFDVIEL